MTSARFAALMASQRPPRSVALWKLIAFLGRYGHQQQWVLRLTIREMNALAEAVGQLIEDENDAMRRRMETDGV